ncbi:hypothetical protein [Paenibacillus polymyxa]|uniref:hypothetical protein n=1 Tax=Paenibacillus polymyxa TaxID=1406 RepID=UPI001378EED9|nr:hypothetical protein [Paenibacillus polymyxa]
MLVALYVVRGLSGSYGGDSSGGVVFYMSAWIEIAVERSKHPTGRQNFTYHKKPQFFQTNRE